MLQRFWIAVDTAIVLVAGCVLVLSVLHVTLDVAMKYFVASPVPGTLVYVSNYYMTMIVFLPLASAELRSQHIVVDLWPRQAPRWLDDLGQRISWAISSGIYLLLADNTLKDAMRKQSEGEYVLDQAGLIVTWPSYFILPVGMGLIALLLASKVVHPGLSLDEKALQSHVQ